MPGTPRTRDLSVPTGLTGRLGTLPLMYSKGLHLPGLFGKSVSPAKEILPEGSGGWRTQRMIQEPSRPTIFSNRVAKNIP